MNSLLRAAALFLVSSLAVSAAQKPNILIYLADDLGYGSINSYGAQESLLKTPHLNKLAAEGV